MEQSKPSRVTIYLIIVIAGFAIMWLLASLTDPHSAPPITTPPKTEISVKPQQKMPEKETTAEDSTDIMPTPLPMAAAVSTEEYFDQLVSDYLDNTASRVATNASRTDIVIRYYSRPGDSNRVEVLKQYKFYLHERPVTDDQMVANSICYGDSVSATDIQLVAYALISQGLPIRQIAPSRYHDDWKANAIEIGYDSTFVDKEVVTLDQLRDRTY